MVTGMLVQGVLGLTTDTMELRGCRKTENGKTAMETSVFAQS